MCCTHFSFSVPHTQSALSESGMEVPDIFSLIECLSLEKYVIPLYTLHGSKGPSFIAIHLKLWE